MSTTTQDLAEALHQLIQMQQRQPPAVLHLDARVQLPKFSGQMNGETVETWIWSISIYFRAHPTLTVGARIFDVEDKTKSIRDTQWRSQSME